MTGVRVVRPLLEVVEDRWADLGACVGANPNMWFSRNQRVVRKAKRICATCPVQWDCAEAGKVEQWGIWGGLTPPERGFKDQ